MDLIGSLPGVNFQLLAITLLVSIGFVLMWRQLSKNSHHISSLQDQVEGLATHSAHQNYMQKLNEQSQQQCMLPVPQPPTQQRRPSARLPTKSSPPTIVDEELEEVFGNPEDDQAGGYLEEVDEEEVAVDEE